MVSRLVPEASATRANAIIFAGTSLGTVAGVPAGALIGELAGWRIAFGMVPISVQTWMFKAAPDAMESGGAVFVATAQISLASGALLGGISVDRLGVASTMVVSGLFATSMALAIAAWSRDDGKLPVKLRAVH